MAIAAVPQEAPQALILRRASCRATKPEVESEACQKNQNALKEDARILRNLRGDLRHSRPLPDRARIRSIHRLCVRCLD